MKRPAPAAILVGLAGGFVGAVDLVRRIRPALLIDADLGWALPRLLLGLAAISGAALVAGIAAGAFFLFAARSRIARDPIEPFPWPRGGAVAIAVAAVVLGAVLRFAALDSVPASLWIDDLSLVAPALALRGVPADFADSIRPAPFGVAKPYGSVGVLYLEEFRLSLRAFGTTVFGVRFPAAAAGVCSIVLVYFLARALLPRGGAALAALLLAGMRWPLILSRWGWNEAVLVPVIDAAALLLLFARRRRSAVLAATAGGAAGLGAHLYLSAWVAGAGLFLLAAWPARDAADSWRFRRRLPLRIPLAYAAAFALVAAPLFLLKEGRIAPYFARASDHNLLREISWAGSPMPALAAAADSLIAPWGKSDPDSRNDVPGRTRLGWLLGIPVALALGRAIAKSGEERSAYFLSLAAAAFAGSVAGGEAGLPNGYRFGFLADATAIAAAAGLMLLAGVIPAARRREAALAAILVAVWSGAVGARDALIRWPVLPETFDGFHGQDTLVARSARRWERFGRVAVEKGKTHSPIPIEAIRRYGLDSESESPARTAGGGARFGIRIAAPDATPGGGERTVERVRDAFGRDWAVVLAGRE